MSDTIDNKVVSMSFDNQNFEKNAKESMATTEKLKESLRFEGIEKGFQVIEARFSAMQVVAATCLANITNQVVNTGKSIMSALTIDPVKTGFSEYETKIGSIQTILANTQSEGTTLSVVSEALDKLNVYADKTIYNFTEMTRNIGTFTAAGVKLQTSVNAIQGIANLAAISGSTTQQASTAMYQLSQALSSGTVKLMDWNSVVNAGMGGQVFQDALKETARVMGVNIDAIIAKNGSFRESLKEGWLTSEILTDTLEKFTMTTEGLTEAEIEAQRQLLKAKGYTEEQIDEIFKLGEMATDAATKVKTLTQLFDTLKEAAQSGWTRTWELFFGDFEEAKVLFTEISDIISAMINKSAEERNDVFGGALLSNWKLLEKEISAAEIPLDKFEAAITEVGIKSGAVTEKMITDAGGLAESTKNGWVTTDIMTEALKLLSRTSGDTAEEIAAMSEKIKEYDNISGFFGNSATALGEAMAANAAAMTSDAQEVLTAYETLGVQLKTSTDEAVAEIEAQATAFEASLDANVTATENAYDTEITALEDKLDAESSALEKSQNQQLSALEEAHDAKLALIDEEYLERLKVVDEEKYNKLKAIDKEIDALNAKTDAENKAADAAEKRKQRLSLLEKVGSASTPAEKKAAEQALADFDKKLEHEKVVESRKNRVEELKDEKTKIKEAADAEKAKLKETFDNRKKIEDDFYDYKKEALKEEQDAEKKLLDKEHKEKLKVLDDEKKAALDNIKEINKAELKAFKETNDAKKAEAASASEFRDANDVFFETIVALSKIEDETERNRLATTIFGDELGKIAIAAMDFLNKIQNGVSTVEELVDNLTKLGGRELIIDTLRNAFTGLMKIVDAVKGAFRTVFPPATSEQIYSVIEAIHSFSEKLVISDESAEKLKTVLTGVFSVFGILVDAIKAVVGGIAGLIGGLPSIGSGFLDAAEQVGIFLTNIRDTIRESGFVKGAVETVGTVITNVVGFVVTVFTNATKAAGDFFAAVKEKISCEPVTRLCEALDSLKEKFKGNSEESGGFFDKVKNVFVGIGKAVAESEVVKVLGAIWDGIKRAVSGIFESAAKLGGGLVDWLSNAGLMDIMAVINTIVSGGIGIGLVKIVNGLGDMTKGLGKFMKYAGKLTKSLKGILDGVGDVLGGFAKKMKAEAVAEIVKSIAIAVALLVASIWVISKMDPWMVAEATSAIVGLVSGLVIAVRELDKLRNRGASIGKDGAKFEKSGVGGTILSLAAGVLILSFAVKKLGEMDPVQLGYGLGAMIITIGMLTICMRDISKNEKEMQKGLRGVKSLTTGVLILASAVKVFGEMDIWQLVQGMIAMGLTLKLLTQCMTELGETSKKMGEDENFSDIGPSILAVAAGIFVLSLAMKIMGSMPIDQMGVALIGLSVGLGAIFGVLVGISKLTGKENESKVGAAAGAIVAVAAGLLILSLALKVLGSMSIDKMAVAVGGMVIALAAIFGVLVGLSKLAPNCIVGAAALVIAAAAIAIFTPAILALSLLSWDGLIISLVALGGVFAIIGAAGFLLAPVAPIILLLSVSIGILGMGLLSIGAGLALAGVGMTIMSVSLVAFSNALAMSAQSLSAGIYIIVEGLASLIPLIISKIGEGIVAFIKVIGNSANEIVDSIFSIIRNVVEETIFMLVEEAPKLAEAVLVMLSEVLTSLVNHAPDIIKNVFTFIIQLLDGLVTYAPQIIDRLFAFLLQLLDGLIKYAPQVTDKVFVFIGSVISGIGDGIGIIIDSLSGIFEAVGNVIGALIGGVIKGVAEGIFEMLPDMGTQLSIFMENADVFVKGVKDITPETLEGTKSLVGIILALTAASVVNGIVSFFSGGDAIAEFAEEMPNLGKGVKGFADEIGTDLKPEAITAAANAGKIIAELAASVPATGGLAQFFTGTSDYSTFATEMPNLGKGIKGFADALVDGDGNTINSEAITAAANAGKIIAELADSAPAEGGVLQFFTGTSDYSTFATEMPNLGKGVKGFADALLDEKGNSINADSVDAAVKAGKIIAELTASVPATGGLAQWFAGTADYSTFATEMPNLGKGIKGFADALLDGHGNNRINSVAVDSAVIAAKAVCELANNAPVEGGLAQWFTGTVDYETFATEMPKLGKGIKEFANSLLDGHGNNRINDAAVDSAIKATQAISTMATSVNTTDVGKFADFGSKLKPFGKAIKDYHGFVHGMDPKILEVAVDGANDLIEMAKGAQMLDSGYMVTFGNNLRTFGETGVDGFVSAFTNSSEKVKSAATTTIGYFTTEICANSGLLTKAFSDAVNLSVDELGSKEEVFGEQATNLMEKFEENIKKKTADVLTTFTNMMNGIIAKTKSKYGDFRLVGKSLATKFTEGVSSGMNDIQYDFKNSINKIATVISDSYFKFRDNGVYLVKGFANGIKESIDLVDKAATDMAQAVLDAIEETLDIHSPSKRAYSDGAFTGQGFVNSLLDYAPIAYDAGKNMANSAADGLKQTLAKASEYMNLAEIADPVIRPVVDLSDVKRGADTISGMFGKNRSIALANSANVQMNSAIEHKWTTSVSTKNDDVVSAITSLRKDMGVMTEAISKMQVVMDTGSLVGTLATPMDKALGKRAIRNIRERNC